MKMRNGMVLAALLVCVSFIFAGCAGTPPVCAPAEDTPNEANVQTVALTEAQITEIEAFLNDSANNGFVGSLNQYTSPQEVDLQLALYDGAGISRSYDELSEEEKQVIFRTPMTHFVFKEADIEAFLQEKVGVSLSEITVGLEAFDNYEECALYDLQHTDTNYLEVDVTGGQVEGDRYSVQYTEPYFGDYVVTLIKTESGYRFFSNERAAADLVLTYHLNDTQPASTCAVEFCNEEGREIASLTFADKLSGAIFQTIELTENAVFTQAPVYFADATFDGNVDVFVPYCSDVSTCSFYCYVWDTVSREFVEAPDFTTLWNPVIDSTNERVLCSGLRDDRSPEGEYQFINYHHIYQFDTLKKDFILTNSLRLEGREEGSRVIESTYDRTGTETIVHEGYAACPPMAVDRKDPQVAAYFNEGGLWDLGNMKWDYYVFNAASADLACV